MVRSRLTGSAIVTIISAFSNKEQENMAKYLFRTSYTQAGVEGLIREGGTGRRDALRQTVEGLGGALESFYYAFGDDDLLLIVDLPNDEAATAFSMFVSAAGALTVSCTVLITPESVDGAISKNVAYRKPGD
ncbi:MAG: GYD domain-containing protein [Gammaproteobacteria bacterium]|nr:GYD domain-containing protein [Gammaproteobacteria bacterium]MYK05765.1 GYD domain-containing protein [Gammaproteobacteria bacterium]